VLEAVTLDLVLRSVLPLLSALFGECKVFISECSFFSFTIFRRDNDFNCTVH
jgi:hypothetical protein